jgi:hypothetical protein
VYQIPGATEQTNVENDPYGGSSLDPRFIAARKIVEAREAALKAYRTKNTVTLDVEVTPAQKRNDENASPLAHNVQIRPQTAVVSSQSRRPSEAHKVDIKKPTQEEVQSSKGFSLKPACAPEVQPAAPSTVQARPASVRPGPRSSTASAKSRMSAAQKLDQFITINQAPPTVVTAV